MNFLAPLFLAGAAAIALPIFFHLVRRTTRDRVPFSSLRFLTPSPPLMNRRSRLEHLLLLLLRCAALVLLAAGFARPFLRHTSTADTPPNPTRRVAHLGDSSASMRRPGLWDDARSRAAAILRRAEPVDEFAVFTFNRTTTPRFTFEEWSRTPVGERAALALTRLDDSTPGWSATHLGDALIAAAESLQDQGDTPFTGRKEILLITDLQEGSRLDRVQGYDWPKDVALRVETARPAIAGNAGLQIIGDPHGAVATTSAVVRVRVTNASDSRKEQFTVAWAQSASQAPVGVPQEIYVPPGQSRTVSLLTPTNTSPDRIILQGDDEPFDNTVFVFPPEPVRLPIVYLGEDTREDSKQPLFFLRRALPATPGLAVSLTLASTVAPAPAGTLENASLIVATGSLDTPAAEALQRAIQSGKTLLFAPRRVEDLATLALLLGIPPIDAEERKPSSYAMLAELDFRHPLLTAFADPRFSDFTRIHFWKYRRLDPQSLPQARVFARFDSGDPAWLEIPLQKGRIIVLTSGWHPEDSQLALSTKFVPLLFSMIESGGAALRPSTFVQLVDAPVTLPAAAADTPIVVRAPGAEPVTLPAGTLSFTEAHAPGIYEITVGEVRRQVAVNLDPSESLTAPRNPDDLERVGAPLADVAPKPATSPARTAQLAAAEAENRQKLWRWFIIATLLVLLTETAVAGWSVRKRTPAGEVTA